MKLSLLKVKRKFKLWDTIIPTVHTTQRGLHNGLDYTVHQRLVWDSNTVWHQNICAIQTRMKILCKLLFTFAISIFLAPKLWGEGQRTSAYKPMEMKGDEIITLRVLSFYWLVGQGMVGILHASYLHQLNIYYSHYYQTLV